MITICVDYYLRGGECISTHMVINRVINKKIAMRLKVLATFMNCDVIDDEVINEIINNDIYK